jgi:precorrin-6B methylase 1
LLFEDEVSLSNTATVSYVWSKKREQPKLCQLQKNRERKTILVSVNPKTGEIITHIATNGIQSVISIANALCNSK